MKTINNLFELVANEISMNAGKIVQYTFDIDTRYQVVSMYVNYDPDQNNDKNETIFSRLPIKTAEEVQLVFWFIWNKGRSRNIKTIEPIESAPVGIHTEQTVLTAEALITHFVFFSTNYAVLGENEYTNSAIIEKLRTFNAAHQFNVKNDPLNPKCVLIW